MGGRKGKEARGRLRRAHRARHGVAAAGAAPAASVPRRHPCLRCSSQFEIDFITLSFCNRRVQRHLTVQCFRALPMTCPARPAWRTLTLWRQAPHPDALLIIGLQAHAQPGCPFLHPHDPHATLSPCSVEDLYSCRALLDSLGMHQTKIIAKVPAGPAGPAGPACCATLTCSCLPRRRQAQGL